MRINEKIKQIRAEVIATYLHQVGIKDVLCFSSGNCAKYLKMQGLNVLAVVNPQEWYTPEQIGSFGLFDATSGNIPMFLINRIAERFAKDSQLGRVKLICDGAAESVKNGVLRLPTGSGESLLIIKLAYPHLEIEPIYDLDEATKYNEGAPLNAMVNLLRYKQTETP